MPLSNAFYSDSQPQTPGMFQQPDHEMSAYQPPPVPDLFRRPMTPAQAQQPQGNFLDRQNAPAPQQPQQQAQPDPNAQQGAGGPQAASQMAQALLLYQMLQGGPNQFLNHLMPGMGYPQQRQGLGQQASAFSGLQDPSIQGLFQQQSYFKPSMANGMRMGVDPGQFRQMYQQGATGGGRDRPAAALAPDAYQNAIQFLQGILGIA